ncbi:ferredoxin--NADP reductase [Pelagibius sp. Alg239-R121]|uniref:ferredoxin--NADP reductase n=1 Tax=Pelagibius sp. Alg239-R121 TaxID=2993448 RepID=UPI0024A74CD3|nr:ferredoxin--NADP reductase [Pelagibius sp. Alg239-R121]
MNDRQEDEDAAGPSYHRLTVRAVRDETADAKSFVLIPERHETALYRYRPGQFLSFRIPHEVGPIVRSYSLSSAPGTDPDMTVCVKRVVGGRGSNWFNDHLRTGARIEATRPAGRFVLRDNDKPLLLIAGGSGITPCISLIKQALAETGRRVKLIYANQNAASVIYRATLDLLESRFDGRFTCQHWLDDDRGFLTADDVMAAAEGWECADSYICGPAPLMDMTEETLGRQFGGDAVILTERFLSPDDPVQPAVPASAEPVPAPAAASPFVQHAWFRLSLDGEDHSVPIAEGQTLLQAALAFGVDVPSSCTEGHCGTCMAQLRSGEVTMASTRALSKRNIARGYVLACQSTPSSTAEIWLDFDL